MKFDHPSGRTPYKRYQSKQAQREHRQPAPDFFKRKRLRTVSILIAAAVLSAGSSALTGFTPWTALTGIPYGVYWLIRNFFPSAASLTALPVILVTLLKTAVIAVSASSTAAAAALGVALIGSRTTGRIPALRIPAAAAASFLRNIPLPAWSILLLLSFKQNTVTGFLALFFITAGHLARAFMDIIDSHAEEASLALKAAGAPHIVTIIHGVLPNTMPLFISWTLYAIETNVRDSALIGILTGTGIGFLFDLYFKSFRYNEAGLIIAVLMLSVLCIDAVSNAIRRVLL